MTAREAQAAALTAREAPAAALTAREAQAAAGTAREAPAAPAAAREGQAPMGSLQGLRFDVEAGDDMAAILADALDYRGDVTLHLRDGSAVTGYLYSAEGSGAGRHVSVLPQDPDAPRRRLLASDVLACEFSGRDTADGRSWEAWVRRWQEKRKLLAQGIDVGDIEPQAPDV